MRNRSRDASQSHMLAVSCGIICPTKITLFSLGGAVCLKTRTITPRSRVVVVADRDQPVGNVDCSV